MEHPFLDKQSLETKSLEELQDSMASLMTKLTFAYRTNNGPLIHQLQMVLEAFRNQHNKKMDEIFEKQKLNTKINVSRDNELKN